MTVSANTVDYGIPYLGDSPYHTFHPSGTGLEINPGDWVAFSGNYIVAANTGVAYWKASGAGMAVDRNPAYDPAGRQVVNSALVVALRGTFVGSAAFSGQPLLGVMAAPVTTGSGVNGPSGNTGVGTKWQTAAPNSVSGGTAAPVAGSSGVVKVIGFINSGPAGTGQLILRVAERLGDYY